MRRRVPVHSVGRAAGGSYTSAPRTTKKNKEEKSKRKRTERKPNADFYSSVANITCSYIQ